MTNQKTKWHVIPDVLSSKIEDEVVLMSIEADSYFILDPVGSHIWELLFQQPSSSNELVDQLIEEYDVDRDTCNNDVQSFINEMVSRKLIISTEE